MSRYIDADKYKQDLIQLGFLPALVVRVLDKQPTIDVEEVRHGYWTKTTRDWAFQPTNSKYEYICSACGERELDMRSFCPNCGAKMDGERREQNEG